MLRSQSKVFFASAEILGQLGFYFFIYIKTSVAEPVHFWPDTAPGIFFTGSGSYKKVGFQPLTFFLNSVPSSLLEKFDLFLSICFLNSLLSMWEQTKRISLRILSVLSTVWWSLGCPLISLASKTKRNESENERSEIARKKRLVSLVSLWSETGFFVCETKLYVRKNTENTVPKIPKISKHFLQNGLKKTARHTRLLRWSNDKRN